MLHRPAPATAAAGDSDAYAYTYAHAYTGSPCSQWKAQASGGKRQESEHALPERADGVSDSTRPIFERIRGKNLRCRATRRTMS